MIRLLIIWSLIIYSPVFAQDPSTIDLDKRIIDLENRRIKAIKTASASTVSIFSSDGKGGGSGVLVDPSGLALTNFHVVDPCGPHMVCGLNDGKTYHAVVVGVDPVGDLALIKLIGDKRFPTAVMGNSDTVQVGQSCFAAGNPFLLAHDFSPTITWGVVSGTNRYQYPSGTLLEYADCIQTDAAINPGNSGGPLFDENGILIGINGRGSFEKRGRLNVGVGYAISINQAKRFYGNLKSGRILDHARLGFIVATAGDRSVRISSIPEESEPFRKGLQYDDEILKIADRPIQTVNDVKNTVGSLPPNWSIPVVFRRDGKTMERLIRLSSAHSRQELLDKTRQAFSAEPTVPDLSKVTPKPIRDVFEKRLGFANYYFNRQETERILDSLKETYNPNKLASPRTEWKGRNRLDKISFVTNGKRAGIRIGDQAATLSESVPMENQISPKGSGGFLNAIQVYQKLIFEKNSELTSTYVGKAPYLSAGEKEISKTWSVDATFDVLRILCDGTESLIYVNQNSEIAAIEFFSFPSSPPCIIEFRNGKLPSDNDNCFAPRQIDVFYRQQTYLSFEIESHSSIAVDVQPTGKEPLK